MPKHLLKPPPEALKKAIILAGALTRRCRHLTFPIIEDHGLTLDHRLPASLTRLINNSDRLGRTSNPIIALHVPAGQEVLSCLAETLAEPSSTSKHPRPEIGIITWDCRSQDDPHAATQFMQAAAGSRTPSKAIVLSDSGRQNSTSPGLIEHLNAHFEGKIPLFSHHSETLVCHSIPGRAGSLMELRPPIFAGLMAIAVTYSAFCDLDAAVESVEPDEADALRDIYEDIFSANHA